MSKKEVLPDGYLPAGKYYIGDPCYVLGRPHSNWESVLDESNFFENPYINKGLTALAFGTAFGDGEYLDQDGRKYPVDAGLIGATPVKMATVKKPTGVHLLEFLEPFLCTTDGAVICFGRIRIDTDPQGEDEDYEK